MLLALAYIQGLDLDDCPSEIGINLRFRIILTKLSSTAIKGTNPIKP